MSYFESHSQPDNSTRARETEDEPGFIENIPPAIEALPVAPVQKRPNSRNIMRTSQNLSAPEILKLQRTIGNRAVARLLSNRKKTSGETKEIVQRFRETKEGENMGAVFTEAPEDGGVIPAHFSKQNKFYGLSQAAPFIVKAEFKPDRKKTGEKTYKTMAYRQYIKGYYKVNNVKNKDVKVANGKSLVEDEWNEDGFNGGKRGYGTRGKNDQFSKYFDIEGEGSRFEGVDYPNTFTEKGKPVEVNISFRGDLVETDQDGNDLGTPAYASRTWHVYGQATTPKK